LGFHGNPVIRTPHLDALAAESVRFTQLHVGPTCAPTRAALLTGHHANSTGVWHTIGGRSLLRKDEWTLAAALQESGYKTGLFGKWHLGDEFPYRPHDRGFEESVCHGGGGISQTPDWWGNDYFDDTYRVNGQPAPFEGYCTDVFFGQARDFITRHRDRPFFCMIAPNAPHSPFNVPTAYQRMYADCGEPETYQRFMGMVTNIDDNVGRLREHLQEQGCAGNTILIFMSDNGTCGSAWAGRTDPWRAGMRGEKGSEYDGGHRVPFFMNWPGGGLTQGRDVDTLTSCVDFMPTLLELCDVEVPEGRTFHGLSLVPLIQGHAGPIWDQRIVVTDSQRVPFPIKWKQSAAMCQNWRLVNGRELYDIAADPAQQDDIAERHPGIVRELRNGYETWWNLVSGRFDEEIPISIGPTPVCLNAHDWRNESGAAAWSQADIRQGIECNGYWEVFVEDEGDYVFELRRWPREAGHPLCHGFDGTDIVWREEECWPEARDIYVGGRALPVRSAQLHVSGLPLLSQRVDPHANAAVFRLTLPAGPARVQTWFSDGSEFNIGAYFIYVTKSTGEIES
jgi:arylsulfatase A-like enzyme